MKEVINWCLASLIVCIVLTILTGMIMGYSIKETIELYNEAQQDFYRAFRRWLHR